MAELEARLRQVVREQMVADVPLGAFLSGGIDSSTVVALMQAQSGRPIQTFTIGFGEAQFNEAGYAQAVAHHLGTDHTALQVTPQDCLAVIPQLPTLYDEPLADVSQIPTTLVARLARQRVTVSLSGDGGDEVFGGYTPYLWGQRIWNALGFWPLGWRQGLAQVLAGRPTTAWNRDFARLGLPNLYFAPGESLHRLAAVLREKEPAAMFPHLVAKWCDPSLALQTPWSTGRQTEGIGRPAIEQWMVQDSQTSLPDGILAKVDRATMAVGLESRAPLLDPRIVSFAWQLPLAMKVRGSTGKWVLRQVLYRHVPRALVDRPKMGFLIPLAEWLRQPPLREWGEDLLAPERLQAEGYFRPAVIRQLWQEHQQGRYNWQMQLWPVLTLQAWLSSL
ncbi:MAG: 7-cyano-7-deazaguanine synthase [Gloeomargaritaceae cyanobacterium C42_A2020_066]|nr:7-cyano-7-deazaguanine synthase [Gloeomargaritaceae cyanobacterium C42_A2020_066]